MSNASATATERIILEVLLAMRLSPAQAVALLAPTFDVAPPAVTPLVAGAGAVNFELVALPGSFPSKLTLFIDPALAHGPKTDADLARELVARTGAMALSTPPAGHPGAEVPFAWLLHAPGREGELVVERPRDDAGIDLV